MSTLQHVRAALSRGFNGRYSHGHRWSIGIAMTDTDYRIQRDRLTSAALDAIADELSVPDAAVRLRRQDRRRLTLHSYAEIVFDCAAALADVYGATDAS